jgi:hypothetical protein
MLKTTCPTSFLAVIPVLLAAGLFLGGCTATRELEARLAEMELQNKALREENRRLVETLDERKNTAARLQLELVRKQVEIGRSHSPSTGSTSRESAALQDRVPPPNSKAEAVICLAEAESEVGSTKESALFDKVSPDWAPIDGLLADSREALTQDRYDQACVLAYQALHATRERQLQSVRDRTVKASIYTDFVEPIPLHTLKPANLRSRASSTSSILDTLAAGTKVLATGYRGRWIKVTTDRDRQGWVYYTLLEVMAPDSEDHQH